MTIVKATIRDLGEVAELFDLYRVFYKQPSDIDRASAFIEERLKNEDSVIFLALDGEKPVGFTQLYPSFSSVSMKRTWILNDLYVKKSVRGKGYGEKLVTKAIEFASETDSKGVLLETAADNVGAQSLYEKVGFAKESNYFYFYTV